MKRQTSRTLQSLETQQHSSSGLSYNLKKENQNTRGDGLEREALPWESLRLLRSHGLLISQRPNIDTSLFSQVVSGRTTHNPPLPGKAVPCFKEEKTLMSTKNTHMQIRVKDRQVKRMKMVLALHDVNSQVSFEWWVQKALPTTLHSWSFFSADLPGISDPSLLHLTICHDLYNLASLSSFILSCLVAFIFQYYIPPGMNFACRVFFFFPVLYLGTCVCPG